MSKIFIQTGQHQTGIGEEHCTNRSQGKDVYRRCMQKQRKEIN